MSGEVSALVRKIGSPWKTYLSGIRFIPDENWKEYSFTQQAPTDVDSDIAVLFATGNLGVLIIDDLKVEQFEEPLNSAHQNTNPVVKGNLIPRSSVEGKRDYFWSSGIYSGPDGEWEDPQAERVSGGLYGSYALKIPSAKTEGTTFTRSSWIPVAADTPYTFSFYLKGEKPGSVIQTNIFAKQGKKGLGQKTFIATDKWQRCSISISKVPAEVTDIYLGYTVKAHSGDFFIDGLQFEAEKEATAYTPSFPYELYADMDGYRSNIVFWGEAVKLNLYAGSANIISPDKNVNVTLIATAFPDKEIFRKTITLPVNKETPYILPIKANGLIRLTMVAEKTDLAAPQEVLIARLPQPRNTGADSSFGGHISIRPFFIDYAKKIGLKWIRFHDATLITKWKGVEAIPGKYRYYDTQVNAAVESGLHILGLPDYPPEWALKQGKTKKEYVDLLAFRELCKNLAAHYKGKIDYWEIWNEPYMKYFFGGKPSQFPAVFEAGATGVREGNQKAKILGFCTELTDKAYAKNMPIEKRGIIDILSVHSYFTNIPGGGSADLSREVKSYLSFLQPHKPEAIWNTEGNNRRFGSNSFYTFIPVSKRDNINSAAFGSRVWIEQINGGISKFFIYTLHQSDTIMYHDGYQSMIGFDRSVPPQAVASAVTAWCIDGMKPVSVTRDKGIIMRAFSDNRRTTLSIFDDSAVTGKLNFDINKIPKEITVIDLMGNNLRDETSSTYIIDAKPVFLISNWPASKMQEACIKAVSKN